MKCPNCGKNVRSKNQCAHCGYVFNKKDVKESQEVSEIREIETEPHLYQDEPRPRRKSGAGSLLWGILKLVIGIAILFALFLFGPRIYNSVMEYFQPSDTEVVDNQPESQPDSDNQVAQSDTEETDNNDVTEMTTQGEGTLVTGDEETTIDPDAPAEETTLDEESEEAAGAVLASSEVDLASYPLIAVELDFDDLAEDVNGEDFEFEVETNGNVDPLNLDYSLIRDGNTLSLSYTDPSVSILTTEDVEQVLHVRSEELGIEETVTYTLPSATYDSEVLEEVNSIIDDNLSDLANVSAVIYQPDADSPIVYDNESIDAGALIGWFVLDYTYDQVNQGEISLDDVYPMNPELIGSNDEGTIATAGEGTEFIVNDYIIQVVHNRDVTAMNHLIDLGGGPNDFNLWLNESGFFATRITELLGLDDEFHISGAMTSAHDVANLLLSLSNLDLNGEELDEAFLTNLLDSPLTEKFPYNDLVNVIRRYEISSGDTNLNDQHYAGIIETENGNYIVAILSNQFETAEPVVAGISQSIYEIITFLETGESGEDVLEEEETTVEITDEVVDDEADSQVEIITEEPQEVVGNTGPYEEWQLMVSESGIVYGPDDDGDGFRDTYRNEAGQFVPINWYQGEDGLWYFNEGN